MWKICQGPIFCARANDRAFFRVFDKGGFQAIFLPFGPISGHPPGNRGPGQVGGVPRVDPGGYPPVGDFLGGSRNPGRRPLFRDPGIFGHLAIFWGGTRFFGGVPIFWPGGIFWQISARSRFFPKNRDPGIFCGFFVGPEKSGVTQNFVPPEKFCQATTTC